MNTLVPGYFELSSQPIHCIAYLYVCTVLYSMIPLSFFFAVCIYNNVRTLLWFTVVHLAACRRDDEQCHVSWRSIDGQEKSSGFVLCTVLCSFLFGRRYRIEWIPVESGIHCILLFCGGEQENPADSGFHWNMADSSGFQ
jgi:hypothetical protein